MATATHTAQPAPLENFAALFEESLARQEMRQGELITAEVTRVDYNVVVVNAGLKSESFIPIEEFKNDNGVVEVKPGDFVTVAIESIEDGYGAPLDTQVTFTLTPSDGGTRLRMVHSGFRPSNHSAYEGMSKGWPTVVGRLGELAGEPG